MRLSESEQRGEMPDVWVLELSSFQLETTSSLKPTPPPCSTSREDHWTATPTWTNTPRPRRAFSPVSGVQVLNRDDALQSWRWRCRDAQVETFGLDAPAQGEATGGCWKRARRSCGWRKARNQLMPVAELPLAGLHNAANALAALALCRAIDLPLAPAAGRRCATFKGLPHRVENVAEINGVTFYDDSKGTNVGATVAALNGMPQQGGADRRRRRQGPGFHPARAGGGATCPRRGADRPRWREDRRAFWHDCGVPLLRAGNMEEAVQLARARPQPGDAVLLSPACASFDMFRNYEHRAEVFIDAVQQLVRGH